MRQMALWKYGTAVARHSVWGLWKLLTILGAVVGVTLVGLVVGVIDLDPLAIAGVAFLVALVAPTIGSFRAWNEQRELVEKRDDEIAELTKTLHAPESLSLSDRLKALAEEGEGIVTRLRNGTWQVGHAAGAFEKWRSDAVHVLQDMPVHLHDWFAERAAHTLIWGDPYHPSPPERVAQSMSPYVEMVRTITAIQEVIETKSRGEQAINLLVQNRLLALGHEGRQLAVSITTPGGADAAALLASVRKWDKRVAWLADTALPPSKTEWLRAAGTHRSEVNMGARVPADIAWRVIDRHPRLGHLQLELHAGEWSVPPGVTADQLAP